MAHSQDIDLDSVELCLIDSGIADLEDVPLRSHLQVLNLHSNYISKIHSISHLKFLKHLDLSANRIQRIEGLDGLVSLKTLNLSCNHLRDVFGLGGLRSLKKLNVSFNQIADLTGMKSLAGPGYNLSHVDLHGNSLHSVAHVAQCLCRCNHLQKLTLSRDNSDNPLCQKPGYEMEVLSGIPQLQTVDGIDRSGKQASSSETDIPGLDEYIDYLLAGGVEADTSKVSMSADMKVVTPNIDQVLERYKQRGQVSSSDTSTVIQSVTDTEQSPASSRRHTRTPGKVTKDQDSSTKPLADHDERLQMLEKQISELLTKTKSPMPMSTSSTGLDEASSSTVEGPVITRHQAERDILKTDGSDSEGMTGGKTSGKKGKKSRLPSYRRSTAASRARKDKEKKASEVSDTTGPPGLTAEENADGVHGNGEAGIKTIRNDIQSTYVQLMREMEEERERRWKAEQAAKKLVIHLQKVAGKAKEDSDMKEVAIDATTRLKQAVTNEREIRLRLQEEKDVLKEQLQQVMTQLTQSKEAEASQGKSLREMEEMMAKLEREKLQQQTHEHKRVQDAQLRAAALAREAEMLRSTVDNQKGQLQQLQSLLANREQEHRDQLKVRYSLGSKEMQEAVQIEAAKKEREYSHQLKAQQDKVDELTKQYTSLENEFREALQIESSRFEQLKSAFETVSEENAANKSALLAAQKKDEAASSMVSELTSLVKEQKGRIAELSKAKQEQSVQSKERIQVLEAHVEEARKRMVQLELLKQENIKLKSQVHGQESVIEGLRSERKLWSKELAQQGASLAQDRGSLEAKIGALQGEAALLRKQLERETDALKIKTKMLEDQTETIQKLKEGLVDRDEEVKKARQEALKIQQNLEEQLIEERTNNQDVQETLDRLRERKEDLKSQVSDLQTELEDSKKAHGVLNNKWKEKSQLIGQLEQQVCEMKDTWGAKEKKLTQERDKALHAANLAIDRLKSADDSFRKELEEKVHTFQSQVAMLEHEKQLEVDQANQRVSQVEDEMRELLAENQAAKRAMEDKVKRLTRAMTDLQSDLY